jgi:hypothetical protein
MSLLLRCHRHVVDMALLVHDHGNHVQLYMG